jgi:hypothetical protein
MYLLSFALGPGRGTVNYLKFSDLVFSPSVVRAIPEV